VPAFEQEHHLFEQPADERGLVVGTGDCDLVAAHEDLDWERPFYLAQELVAVAQEAQHQVVARHEDLDGRARGGLGKTRFRKSRVRR